MVRGDGVVIEHREAFQPLLDPLVLLDVEYVVMDEAGLGNIAGLALFADGRPRPEYVSWSDVAQVDFDRPPAMYPPLGER